MLKVQAFRWITSALCAFAGLSGLAVAAGDEVPAAVSYKSAADIPVADFFRLPRYSQMAMSPDGKRLAALAPVKGRDNLVIVDLVMAGRGYVRFMGCSGDAGLPRSSSRRAVMPSSNPSRVAPLGSAADTTTPR